MKTLAVISLLATTALAQSSGSGASANPLIPSDISTGCSDFITKFNSDPSLTACTKSLIQATQSFGPGGSTGSKADVSSAIDSICTGSVSDSCPDSLIRGQLSNFYAACSDELTSKANQRTRDIYDVLYVLSPLKKAICSKDDSANYCLFDNSDTTSTGIKGIDLSQIQNSLSYTPSSGSVARRAQDPVAANLTTFRSSNLAFLFRQPDMDSATLCTTCTRNILTGYFGFESDVLYAPGLAASQLLGGQTELVGGIQKTCGANFLNGAVQAAGGIKSGELSSGAVKGVSDRFSGLVAIIAGGLTVAISSLL